MKKARTWSRRVASVFATALLLGGLGVASTSPAQADPRPSGETIIRPKSRTNDQSKPQRGTNPELRQTKKYGECDLSEEQIKQRRAKGQTNAMCVTRRPLLKSSVPAGKLGRSASVMLSDYDHFEFQPWWCQELPEPAVFEDVIYHRRFEICYEGLAEVNVVNLQTSQTVFNGIFTFGAYGLADPSVLNWAQTLGLRLDHYTGTLSGLVVTSESLCDVMMEWPCTILEDNGVGPAQVLSEYEHVGNATFRADIDVEETEAEAYVGVYSEFFLTYIGANPVTIPLYWNSFRCDRTSPTFLYPGCVNWEYKPVLQYSATTYPEFTTHLLEAMGDGLPGFQEHPVYCPEEYGACGVELERMLDSYYVDLNRATACPQSWPRPPGKQCDEYPFASTSEGAYTGQYGYSWKWIDEDENQNAGNDLGLLYYNNRMTGGDEFFVEVVS